MNTRLQVEHPITEGITGLDLVQQMIRVAHGHKLNFSQSDIHINGWAVECRVYAEDPYKSFGLPSVGRLNRYIEPLHVAGVRCDSGIREGSEISIYYDPLICKLVTYAPDRGSALDRMRDALDHYVIRGVTHNIPLLRDIVEEKRFRSGDITTKYLPETYPDGFQGTVLSSDEQNKLTAIGGALSYYHRFRSFDPEYAREYPREITLFVALPGQKHVETKVHRHHDGSYEVTVNGQTYKVESDGENGAGMNFSQAVLNLTVNGKPFVAQILRKYLPHQITLQYKGSPFKMSLLTRSASKLLKYMPEKPKIDYATVVLAPMPGMIKSVCVKEGDMVSDGQEVCVVEAMKMQNSLNAGKTGKVKKVNCKEGETVEEGQTLIELE